MEKPLSIRDKAKNLRKGSTRQEHRLWYDFLSTYPIRFRRQVIFSAYIVDFYCEKAHLAIEIDGGQHYEEKGLEFDRRRTKFLEETYHLSVLRFTNLDIERNFPSVCAEIDRVVNERFPPSVRLRRPAPPEGSLSKKERDA